MSFDNPINHDDADARSVFRPLWIRSLDPVSRGYMAFTALGAGYALVAEVALQKARRDGTLDELHQKFVALGAKFSDEQFEELYAEPPQLPHLH